MHTRIYLEEKIYKTSIIYENSFPESYTFLTFRAFYINSFIYFVEAFT